MDRQGPPVDLVGLFRSGARFGRAKRWPGQSAFVAVVAAALLALLPSRSPRGEPTRFVVPAPPGTTIGIAESRTRIAISPDGRRLAMVAARRRNHADLGALARFGHERTGAGHRGCRITILVPGQPLSRVLLVGDGELKKVDVAGRTCAHDLRSASGGRAGMGA